MVRPKPEQFGGAVGKIKSKQVTGVAKYPILTLVPSQFSEGVGWYSPPPLLLCIGTAFEMSGSITYAPVVVPAIELESYKVWIQIDAFDEEALFMPRLTYYDTEERPHQQVAKEPVTGLIDKFLFDIPVEHIESEGWFSCSLSVDLLTPLEGSARAAKIAQGQENPCHPMVLRGAWVEIQGE